VRTLLILASPEAEEAAEELDPFVVMFKVETQRAKGLNLSNQNYKS